MPPMPAHRPRRRTVACITAVVLVAIALLGACGSDPSPAATGADGSTPGTEPTPGAFPVTLTNRLGTVTISQPPTRIVALGTNDIDVVYGLGLKPVGIAKNFATGGLAPWLEGRADMSGVEIIDVTSGVPLEQVAALEPDVILASPLATIDDAYANLNEIAPVVADTEGVLTDTWQERTVKVGRALGREEAARDLVARTESDIAAVVAARPGLKGKTYSLAWMRTPGEIQVMATQDVTSELMAEIGLEIAPALLDQQQVASGGLGAGAVKLSMETVGLLDADLMMVAFNDPAAGEAFEAEPIVSAIPAVAAGRFLAISTAVVGGFRAPTVLGIPWIFEQIGPGLDTID